MHNLLDQLPGLINKLFEVLELLVLRVTLLALMVYGAYSLIKGHP